MVKFWPDKKPFTVKVGETTLVNTKSTKFLGVTIDDCLTWKEHVGNVYNKIQTNKRLLINARNLLPSDALRKIYTLPMYTVISCIVL